ncbi:PAS domain-containing protein [Novispirillum itersonii]|uniref:PAS domain S-box-containing protein n=1 Tax=Novispirillum itersonii TaxID=189 RepID=A0A7W9ZJ62_NOVIT|nr:PAS domain-containing protein [Novispirillum itersonii]MBB6211134.1 PAS domain S-box-containing protein [Novispirillum itersonii]
MGQVLLTGAERFLDPNDVIVSKTDLRGRIVYANRRFCSIADYEEHEVLGQPHSIVRHPLMPRCVFKLLWDTIMEGQELFAYVINRTKHGDHYWVLAHATPDRAADGSVSGFTSCRRAPGKAALAAIRPLYEDLLGIEAAIENTKDGLAASVRALHDHLGRIGTPYDQLMHRLIAAG